MADDALFIGWGEGVRGREGKAVEVFNKSLQYYGQLQQGGKIKSVEAWFLAPHGGDLGGFIMLRGEREQLDDSAQPGVGAAPGAGRDDRRPDGRCGRLYGRGHRPADGPVPGGGRRPGRIARRKPGVLRPRSLISRRTTLSSDSRSV